MKSSSKPFYVSILVTLMLDSAAVQAADETASAREYTYKKDWAVVSAPPPPGPYRAVNIDPRIPGVGAIPPMPLDTPTAATENRIPPEAFANPPAAGIPAYEITRDKPAAAADPGRPRAEPTQQPPPGYYYPAQRSYPAQSGIAPPGAYRNYQQPPRGYYGPSAYPQGQQQVPPPPAYDAMMRNRQMYGAPPGQGTP